MSRARRSIVGVAEGEDAAPNGYLDTVALPARHRPIIATPGHSPTSLFVITTTGEFQTAALFFTGVHTMAAVVFFPLGRAKGEAFHHH